MELFLNYLPQFFTFVLFILGLLVWQKQLIDKRRFEVAEQVLVTFNRVATAIDRLRARHPWFHLVKEYSEGSHYRIEANYRQARYSIPDDKKKAFEEVANTLRPTYVLTKMYLPTQIGSELLSLEEVIARVKDAAARLPHIDPRSTIEGRLSEEDYEPVGEPDFMEEEDYTVARQKQEEALATRLLAIRFNNHDTWSDNPGPPDALMFQMEASRLRLEAACKPYQVPPSLLRFIKGFVNSLCGRDT